MQTKSITEKDITPEIVCAPCRITKVQLLDNYSLEMEFVDGLQDVIEIASRIMSNKAGIFETLKDIYVFNQGHILDGAVTWPGEIDIAPEMPCTKQSCIMVNGF